MLNIKDQLEQLKSVAVQEVLESLLYVVEKGVTVATMRLGTNTLKAVPEAVFTAGTAYAAMTQFGIDAAAAASIVEGIVHLLAKGVYASVASPND